MEVMNMRISMPKTTLGWWSVGFGVAIIIIFLLVPILVTLTGHELEPDSFGLMTLAAAAGVSGIGALVTGLISITKSKERSILVFLALVAGLFALIGAAGMISE
jgi:hypothetical protein